MLKNREALLLKPIAHTFISGHSGAKTFTIRSGRSPGGKR